MKKFLLITIFWVTNGVAQDPEWFTKMGDPSGNFYEIATQAERYFNERVNDLASRSSSEEPYLKQFAKWQSFWKTRIRNTESVQGDMMYLNGAMVNYIQNPICNNTSTFSNWNSLGPVTDPLLSNTNQTGQNLGLIISLWVHPTNQNIIYAGFKFGGLFRTINGLSANPTWVSITENSRIPFGGIKELIVVPGVLSAIDDDIIYIASSTGAFQRAGYGLGVWKSIDGGNTWNSTELSYSLSQRIQTNKLIIHPTNSNILYALTEKYIGQYTPSEYRVFKTIDGGVAWFDLNYPNINDYTTVRLLKEQI